MKLTRGGSIIGWDMNGLLNLGPFDDVFACLLANSSVFAFLLVKADILIIPLRFDMFKWCLFVIKKRISCYNLF